VEFTSRVATAADGAVLRVITDTAIGELQKGLLTDEQIGSSRAIMGVDNQLSSISSRTEPQTCSFGCSEMPDGRRAQRSASPHCH
jgi:hypothetical protein